MTTQNKLWGGGLTALVALVFAGSALAANPSKTEDATRPAGETAERAAADGASDATRQETLERARQGVVLIERAGKVLGVGTVLADDGRILTALSPLAHGNNVDVRFADGSVARVRVGHTDRAWDLALLVPQNGRWQAGLRPSAVDATSAGTALRGFMPIAGAEKQELSPARVIVKGFATMLGGDSELLRDAVEFDGRFREQDLGTPVVDDRGDVVAVVAKACAPADGDVCERVAYGVPVSAIKAFLRTVPPSALPPAPWVGIQAVAADAGPVRGVRVHGVAPNGPAAAAGLQAGASADHADIIVAVDGLPVTTPEQLAEQINQRAVGETVQLLIFGGGRYRQVSMTLQPAASPRATEPVAAPRPVATPVETRERSFTGGRMHVRVVD